MAQGLDTLISTMTAAGFNPLLHHRPHYSEKADGKRRDIHSSR